MFINEAYDFEAPPEVVFSTLTDPERADRWAPPGVRVAWLDRERVRVSFGNSGMAYEVRRSGEATALEWRRSGRPDMHGTVTVEDGPAGGSVLRLDAPCRTARTSSGSANCSQARLINYAATWPTTSVPAEALVTFAPRLTARAVGWAARRGVAPNVAVDILAGSARPPDLGDVGVSETFDSGRHAGSRLSRVRTR